MSTLRCDELAGHRDQNHVISVPNNTTVYAPGQTIQTVWKRIVNHQSQSANNDNVPRALSELDLTITPKKSNSLLYIKYWIFYETHYNVSFKLLRDSTLIGYNTAVGNQRWSGFGVGEYEHSFDNGSTPSVIHLCWVDTPGAGTFTYRFAVTSSGATNYTFFLNRSTGNGGSDSHEVGVSWVMIEEIAQ